MDEDKGSRAELGGLERNSRLVRLPGPWRAEVDAFDEALEIAQHALLE